MTAIVLLHCCIAGTYLCSVTPYWLTGGLYAILDLSGWLSQYKVQQPYSGPVGALRAVWSGPH